MSEVHLSDSISINSSPWDTSWPENETEHLGNCPVCSSAERKIIYEGLVDNIFRCAPGKWTLWRCLGCGSAYLDPRPSPVSIHLAYRNYYTHTHAALREREDYSALNPLRKFRRQLLNGYTNWRFSTQESPALGVLGVLAVWGARPFKLGFDRSCRHLPALPESGGAVLDVGCGGGAFLEIAASLGWNVVGIDPDPKAVAKCQDRGLNVLQGGIEQFNNDESLFDVITLSHVIEHLHDPVKVLKACHRLLKPTGRLWLETPNIDSLGHRQYMENWRGLEPPRHLVLFNRQSLAQALLGTGFARIESRPIPSPLAWLSKQSEAIKQGLPVEGDIQLSVTRKWMVKKDILLQTILPSRKEFLTTIAFKSIV